MNLLPLVTTARKLHTKAQRTAGEGDLVVEHGAFIEALITVRQTPGLRTDKVKMFGFCNAQCMHFGLPAVNPAQDSIVQILGKLGVEPKQLHDLLAGAAQNSIVEQMIAKEAPVIAVGDVSTAGEPGYAIVFWDSTNGVELHLCVFAGDLFIDIHFEPIVARVS